MSGSGWVCGMVCGSTTDEEGAAEGCDVRTHVVTLYGQNYGVFETEVYDTSRVQVRCSMKIKHNSILHKLRHRQLLYYAGRTNNNIRLSPEKIRTVLSETKPNRQDP